MLLVALTKRITSLIKFELLLEEVIELIDIPILEDKEILELDKQDTSPYLQEVYYSKIPIKLFRTMLEVFAISKVDKFNNNILGGFL